MSVLLSAETQALIHAQMKRAGYSSADDMVRIALDVLHQVEDQKIDDEEISQLRASIEQMRRGDTVDWTELSAAARAKHLSR
jgi:Arc/MetJ-type ribon-helix-helix transcriptional regulator